MEQGSLFSADELEVADILVDLCDSVLFWERRSKLVAWGRKRRRSCPARPPLPTGIIPEAETIDRPSPDTPLLFPPSDSDVSHPVLSQKKVTTRRRREKVVESGEAEPSSSREEKDHGGDKGRLDGPGLVNGPRLHLIDLNVVPVEEFQPLDVPPMMAILHQRARSAEARRYRKGILKSKALRLRTKVGALGFRHPIIAPLSK